MTRNRSPRAAARRWFRCTAGRLGLASVVRTREDAFRALLQVAEYFKRTEPHSPVAYALEQAVRWGRMPLPDLLTELIPEQAAREQMFKMVGIKPPEQTRRNAIQIAINSLSSEVQTLWQRAFTKS